MPIYVVKDKGKNVKNKEGQQKYRVFVNYTCNETGKLQRLTKIVYGSEDAKTVERDFERQVADFKKGISTNMTVRELFNLFVASRKKSHSETTRDKVDREYGYFIEPTMNDLIVEKITMARFEQWKQWMESKGKWGLQTRQHGYKLFREILNYGVKMGYIKENRLVVLGNFKDTAYVKKEIDFYEVDEFMEFIEKARQQAIRRQKTKGDLLEWDYYVFFNIAFWCGLRKSEIYGLTWREISETHLNVKRGVVQKFAGEDRITKTKTQKSQRTVQMPAILVDVLKEHKERKMKLRNFSEDDFVCSSNNGRSLRDTTVGKRNEEYARQAKLKRIRIHDFRHSHVSMLVNLDVPIKEISRRVGHAKVEITLNTYSHLYADTEQNTIDAIDKITYNYKGTQI